MFVCVCSIAVKLLGVAYMNSYLAWNLVPPDTRSVYRPLALSLANGTGYQLGGDPRAATRVAPGFPVYLAAVYRASGDDAPVWLLGVLNAFMRAGITCLVYLLALRAFGAAPALFAGLVHAIDPWEAFWSAFVLKESLAVLLSIAAIALVARTLSSRSFVPGIFAGLAIAAASLMRYATLGLFAWTLLLLAWCAWRRLVDVRAAVRIAGAITLGVFVGLSPWLLRNRAVLGVPVVYTQAGYYLFVSNGPGTEKKIDTWGYSGLSTADVRKAEAIAGQHRGVVDRDSAFFREAIGHIVSHPLDAAALVVGRFVNMWRPTFEGASPANIVILGGWFCVFAVASIAGLVQAPQVVAVDGRDTVRVLYWAVLFYVLLHAAFWSEIRYRQYATPILAVFAGVALSMVRDRFTQPRAI